MKVSLKVQEKKKEREVEIQLERKNINWSSPFDKAKKLKTKSVECVFKYNTKKFIAYAHCSHADKFNMNIGKKIALSRALNQAKLPKSVRSQIWEECFNQKVIRK